MHGKWINAAEALPEPKRLDETSSYVIVWIELKNGVGFWAGDRFDHSLGEWEIHGSYEGASITHWMDGPDAPRSSS